MIKQMYIWFLHLYMGASAYRSINDGMVFAGIEEARMAGKIALHTLDGDAVAMLEPGCEETENYQSLLSSMRDVQKEYGILYMYTLYTYGQKIYYGVDTDTSELQAYVGKEFEKSYEMLKGTFAGEDYVKPAKATGRMSVIFNVKQIPIKRLQPSWI